MPCFDPRDPSTPELIINLEKRCDQLTDLLCKAGRAAYAKQPPPMEVEAWWAQHCSWDESRGESWTQ